MLLPSYKHRATCFGLFMLSLFPCFGQYVADLDDPVPSYSISEAPASQLPYLANWFSIYKQADSAKKVSQLLVEKGSTFASDSLFAWGIYYQSVSIGRTKPDAALVLADSAKKLFEDIHHEKGSLLTQSVIRALYSVLDSTEKEKQENEVLLAMIEEGMENHPQQEFYQRALINYNLSLGQKDEQRGDFQSAVETLQEALRTAEAFDWDYEGMIIQLSLGNVHNKMQNYEMAKRYYQKVLETARMYKHTYSASMCINNLAIRYAAEKKYDSSLVFFQEALTIARKMDRAHLIMARTRNVGSIYAMKGDFEKAKPYFFESLAIAKQLRSVSNEIGILNNLMSGYNFVGDHRKSLEISEELIQKAKAIGEKQVLYKAYLNKSNALEDLGQYKAALDYQKKYRALKDSVINEENVNAIAKFEAKYETEKKQRELDNITQQAEIQSLMIRQRNIIIASLIGSVLLLSFLGFFLYRQHILKEKQRTLEAKQKLLRGQMNPHFFFNVLAAIQNFFWEGERPQREGMYLARFAKLMRLVLENSREEFISLEQEIETLEEYLALQKLRFQDSLDYTITYDDSLDIEAYKLPPMLAQPFVENAIEHGLRFKEGVGHIHIHFTLQDNGLALKIEDDGIGRIASAKMNQGTFTNKRSLATTITRERIMLLKQAFNKEIRMDIQDVTGPEGEAEGTEVTFLLPLVA